MECAGGKDDLIGLEQDRPAGLVADLDAADAVPSRTSRPTVVSGRISRLGRPRAGSR